jgi:hypothetical protein
LLKEFHLGLKTRKFSDQSAAIFNTERYANNDKEVNPEIN